MRFKFRASPFILHNKPLKILCLGLIVIVLAGISPSRGFSFHLMESETSSLKSPLFQSLDYISINPTSAQLFPGGSQKVNISYLYPKYGEICIQAIPDHRFIYTAISPQCGQVANFAAAVSVDNRIPAGNYHVTFQATQEGYVVDQEVFNLFVVLSPTHTPPPPPTYTHTPLPTFTPTATWTFTPTPSDTPTLTPTATATEFVMPTPCVDFAARSFSESLALPDLQALNQKAQQILDEVRPGLPCEPDDAECVRKELLKELFGGLVPFAVQLNNNIPFERFPTLGLIQKVLLDPMGSQACGDLSVAGWELVIRFSVYGTPLDGLALHSPGHILARDFSGRRTGFLRDGTVVIEIPDSLALLVGEAEFILAPDEILESADLEGTDEGTFSLDVVQNDSGTVKDVGFNDVPVYENTKAHLDLSGHEPTLAIDLHSDGTLRSVPPSRVKAIPAVIVVPPTETPTATPTETPTATPVYGVPDEIRTYIWFVLLVGTLIFVGIVIFIMSIAWFRSRK